jgi:hypothetical protein
VVGQAPDRYDIRVFELLPLPIQIDIADRHEVVFGDLANVSYYFYGFRRRWKDQAHRYHQNRFKGYRDKRDALRRRASP